MNFTQELLNKKIVFLRPSDPFTWASGIKSPIYCDNRLTLGYPELRTYIAETMAQTITDKYSDCEVIMGTSTAGIPHGTLVADKLNKPCGYVRGGAKKHGRGKQVEGADVAGKKVVVVEDLISTGKSSLEVVDILKEEGAIVLGVVAIFSYNMKKAKDAFSDYKLDVDLITDIAKLLELAIEIEYVTTEEAKKVEKFLENPNDWQ